jgi:two-component system, OmpR family, response regulator
MRILVVEDEHRIANSIKKGLEQEKYAVDVAYTGTDGYDMALGEEYDLILLDLMLPGMDGIQICKQLREKKNQTPILILTARGQVQDKVAGLDNGADDYLTKPFSFEELLARVRALVRRPANMLDQTLVVGNLTLDSAKFVTTLNGKEIRLSNKEFSLLEYLMRQTGQIVTKDQIIAHVWNYESNILPNTVEVYIRNLRKKGIVVETVRGFGYKISK